MAEFETVLNLKNTSEAEHNGIDPGGHMRKSILTVLLGVSILSVPGLAQGVAGGGGISGLVRDSSGSVIPNATVVINNAEKGIKRTLVSNEAGMFSAPSLVPAQGYEVTISSPGFSSFDAKDFIVAVGKVMFVDAVLQVAGTTMQVDLETSAHLVEPGETDVSQVVNAAQISNLPINGRRVDSFVLLAPAVVPDGTFGLLSFRGVAGGNSFLTDGNDTTDQYYNENSGRTRITTQISLDAVQEFQVLLDGYSAEFGRASGGVVNTVTRSGSNDLHGTAYWFFRNQDFNARDRFAAVNPPETRHQAGASLGGHLIPNKLFYFLNGEITRRDFPLSASLVTPPFFDAAGHFVPVQPGGAPTCGAPATAQQCDAAIHFLDRQFQNLDRTANSELGFGKIDWRPNERHAISASFNYLRWLSPNGIQTAAATTNGSGIGNNASSTVRDRYGRLSWTALTPGSAVNEFRFGWFKDKQFDYVSNGLEIPNIGMLGITIQGQINLGTAVDYPRLNPSENRYQFSDNLTWTRNRHTVKVGIDAMTTQDYNDVLTNRAGTFVYPTLTAFAQDYLNNVTGAKHWQSYSQRFGETITDLTTNDYAFYAQDQVRVTAKLTVNLGLRYDYTALPQPIAQSVGRVNPNYPQTGRIPSANRNFAPRLGVAYAVNGSKTVLRAGYGIFYGRYQGGLLSTFFLQNGVSQQLVSFNGSLAQDLAAGPTFPNRLMLADRSAPAGTVDLAFASGNFRNPYTEQGDLAIEHAITPNLGVTISYLWGRGMHLPGVRDLNIGTPGTPVTYRINDVSGNQVGSYTTATYLRAQRIDPRWNRINQIESASNSYYHGLAVQMQKRLSHGLEGSLSYTWSHAIDYNQGSGSQNVFFSGAPSTLFNGDYAGDKGTSALDERHRLTVNTIWAPSYSGGKHALERHLLTNWQLSQMTILGSGFPTAAVVNVIGAPFPGAAFNTTLNGFGGSTRVPFWPVNNLLTDPIIRTDVRISKLLPIFDRVQLRLMFEAFNVFNHTYATNVITRAYDASAGVLTPSPRLGEGSASGGFPDGTNARRAQVAVRLLW